MKRVSERIAIIAFGLFFVMILISENVVAQPYPRISPFPPNYKQTWTTLEDILDYHAFNEVHSATLRQFIVDNYFKPCFVRKLIEPTKNSSRLTFKGEVIQIFENLNCIMEYANLDQPIRPPQWAKGVIGIIEIELSPPLHISYIRKVQKKLIDPETKKERIIDIPISEDMKTGV